MSDSNTAIVAFQAEATWGTTPAPCILKRLRLTKETFEHEKSTVKSGEIRGDRQSGESVEVGADAKGGFDFELNVGDFDQFLEAAFMGAFADVGGVPTLRNGLARKSFLFEKKLTDAAFLSFHGMVLDQMTINLTARQIVTAQASFVGKTGSSSGATLDTSGSYTDAGIGEVLSASAHAANVQEGGAALSSAKSLSFTINNNARPAPVIGAKTPEDIGVGSIAVTGKASLYFRNNTLVGKFFSHAITSFSFELSRVPSGAVTGDHIGYRFTIPAVRITKGVPTVDGKDTDVMIPVEFEAEASAGAKASGTLTASGNLSNDDTVTIGGKAYTAKTVLSNTDGFFLIGASASATLDNLIAAITLGGGIGTGSGTLYAAATTAHPTVTAAKGSASTAIITAQNFGTAGNAIATVEAGTNTAFGAATLAGGVDSYTIKVEKLLQP